MTKMELYQKELERIKKILKDNPKGMTITDISREININRNSVAKYLDILLVSGHVEMRTFGPAKVFFLSQRVPISAMLNFSSDYMLILNRKLEIVYVNDNFLDFMNIEREVLLGKRFGDSSIPMLTSPEMISTIKEALDGKDSTTTISVTMAKEDFYFQRKVVPTIFDDGDRGVTIILENITEHVRARKALRESEVKYSALVEQAKDGVIIAQDGVFKFANKAAAEILGYTVEEILGMNLLDLVVPELREPLAERYKLRMSGEQIPPLYETKMKCKDGAIKEIETSSTIIQHNGKPAIMGIWRDITERKRMEEELRRYSEHLKELVEERTEKLRESEERYRSFVENSRDGIEVFSGTDLLFANPQAARLHGCESLEDFMKIGPLGCVVPEDRETIQKRALARQRGEYVPPIHEFRVRLHDRSLRYLESSSSLLDYGGRRTILAFIRDITERKRYEERLETLHAHATELATAETIEKIAELTLNAVEFVLGFTRASFGLVEGDILRFTSIRGIKTKETISLPLDGPGITVRAVRTGESQLLPDIREDKDFVEGVTWEGYKSISELVVPIVVNGNVEGVINLESDQPNAFTEQDQRLLEILASHTGQALSRIKQTERLRASEERWRSLVELAPDGVLTMNLGGVITSVNKAFLRRTGYSINEIVGKHFTKMGTIRARDLPKYVKMFGAVLRGKIPRRLEYAFTHKDGTTRWAEGHFSLIKIGDKREILAILSEITHRKEMEEELKRSEEKYRTFLESSRDAIFALDSTKYIYVNQRAADLLGFSDPEELTGRDAFEFVDPADREKVKSMALARQRGEGPPSRYEFKLMRRDGTLVPVEVNVSLIELDGKPVSLAINRDITERKRAEEMLRRSEEQARRLLEFQNKVIDTANVWINLRDEEDNITLWNRAAELISGYSSEEVVGHRKIWEWLYPDPEYREKRIEISKRVLRGEPLEKFETVIRCKDGQLKNILWYSNNILDEEGTPTGGIAVGIDITDRKLAEKALRIKESALSSSVNAVALADLEGNLTYANKSFLKIWGYDDVEEVLEKPAITFWQMEEKATEVVETLHDRGVWTGELVARRKNGSTFNTHLSANMVVDAAGKPTCMMASFIDITEPKHLEEELRQSEEKYRNLVENTKDSIVIIDPKGNVLFANKATEELTGYTSEEGIGMNVREITPLKYWPKSLAMLMKARKGDPIPYFESMIRRKDGTLVPVESGGQAIFKNGKVVGVQIITRDITERKHAGAT